MTSVSFPVPQKAAYVKFKNPASRFALVGVFVAKNSWWRARRRDGGGRLGIWQPLSSRRSTVTGRLLLRRQSR